MTEKLVTKLNSLPIKPGVYLFKDSSGEVLYVGKAKNLKNRVRSYFQDSRGHEARTMLMIQNITDLDYIVVSSEIESLILENNLIKQYKPRFNVRLRDDKNYQFIKIDYSIEIPQIYTIRKIDKVNKSKASFFGPYTSGLAVKNTLRLIKQIFPICRNKKISAKPCFAYHLGRCPGICIGQINREEYLNILHEVEAFLKNRQGELIKSLTSAMKQAAARKRFEKAASLRDKLQALNSVWEKQKIVSPHNDNHDYLGVFRTPHSAIINLFKVRGGRLIDVEHFTLEYKSADENEVLEKFIMQYYPETSDLPREIITKTPPPNRHYIASALTNVRGHQVKITVPVRGKKNRLLELAEQNAKLFYEREQASFAKNPESLLLDLQKLLNLPALPARIEGYDISNIQGTNPVGSMVVFEHGRPAKSEYRKFKINIKATPDDFAMMNEMLTRRFAHNKSFSPGGRGQGEGEKDPWPTPNLIVIDGGKGQLNMAVRVLTAYRLSLPVIGLAKRLEEIFLPGQKEPLVLPPDSPVLFLLQQIRDEAHRFAVTFHRKRRSRVQTYSRLSELAGIGPVTRTKLLRKFGSTAEVRKASLEALAEVVGLSAAKKIKEQL